MQLWFNQNGILHDGIGLLLCSYCPCDVPPSGSSSSGSGSGSGGGSDSCTSSTCVEVDCCPGVFIPNVLTVTVTGGTCPQTSTATWDGIAWRKDGSGALSIDISCIGGVWVIQVDFDTATPTVTCDPFSATADFFGTFCGDITVTFTE
jgi:hypothetical protein